MEYGYIYIYTYTNIYTHTYIQTYIFSTYIYIYIHTHTHIHTYIEIAMINPSNSPQTIVTLPQIKDVLATTTATTVVKIKARTNNI